MSITNALIIPSRDDLETMKDFAKLLAGSGMIPDHFGEKPGAVFAIMQKGKELGIPPMYALNNISVIKGKATANSELMLALIYRDHGDAAITFLETNATQCTIEYHRKSGKSGTLTYTMQEAMIAGHPSGSNSATWKKYPANMLRARCISAVARMAFPDSIGGMYTPEELDAPVDDEGNVVQARTARTVPIVWNEATQTGSVQIEGEVVYHPPLDAGESQPAASGDVLIAAIPNDDGGESISKARSRALWAAARKHGWSDDAMHAHIARNYPNARGEDGAPSTRALTMSEAQELIDHINALDALVTYATQHEWQTDELEDYCIQQFPELADEKTSPIFLMSAFEREAIAAKVIL